jgi:hypothetical protein
MEMNKSKLSAFIAMSMFCAVFTITSCSTSDGLNGKTASISIPVNGESFGDDVSSRAAAKVDTVRQSLGDGVTMEATIAPETAVQTRSGNTVADGTQVLVAVYKGSTYYRSLTASISSGKISNLELPTGESLNLKFYAHADKSSLPTATSDGKITDTNTDLMYGHIDGVTLDSNGNVTAGNLSNGFTFKHVYTRARFNIATDYGTITAAGTATMGKAVANTQAVVNLSTGSIESKSGTPSSDYSYTFSGLSTGYQNFISSGNAGFIVLPSLSLTYDCGSKTYGTFNTLNGAFANGKSYNAKISLKVTTYNITYSQGTVSATMPSTQKKVKDLAIGLSSTIPTSTDYLFNGWKDTAGNTYKPGDSYSANAGLNLTAQWVSKCSLPSTIDGTGKSITIKGYFPTYTDVDHSGAPSIGDTGYVVIRDVTRADHSNWAASIPLHSQLRWYPGTNKLYYWYTNRGGTASFNEVSPTSASNSYSNPSTGYYEIVLYDVVSSCANASNLCTTTDQPAYLSLMDKCCFVTCGGTFTSKLDTCN